MRKHFGSTQFNTSGYVYMEGVKVRLKELMFIKGYSIKLFTKKNAFRLTSKCSYILDECTVEPKIKLKRRGSLFNLIL